MIRNSLTRRIACAIVLTVAPNLAHAQEVGHEPAKSPYKDLETTQELTPYAGWYSARPEPAGVAPRSGALIGVHYGWRVAGPATLISDVFYVNSQRRVIDPSKGVATRVISDGSTPLYGISGGLGLSLPGGKSWHDLVPEARGALALLSDFSSKTDPGGFRYGTRFAFVWGAGVRYVAGGRWGLRADWTNYLHTISYPTSFFVSSADGTTVLPSSTPRSLWRNDPTLSLGVSYLFSR